MRKIIFLIIGLSLSLFSCDKETQVVDPLQPVPDQGDVDDSDDLNPDPTPTPSPTPPPAEHEIVTVKPSDIHYSEMILTYKRRRAKPYQLGIPTSREKECHHQFTDRCMIDGQVIFQFPMDEINKNFPKELWDVTSITMRSDFYAIRHDDPSDLICLSNNRVCSGRLYEKYRERKFWRGDLSDHLKTPLFYQDITQGLTFGQLKVRKDLDIRFSRYFSLTDLEVQTLVRKSPSIILNIGKDIFAEGPELKIHLKRRLPSAN